MIETVLVTGGTGFIASWCIVDLLQHGYTVRTTVRNLSKDKSVRSAIALAVDPGNRLSVCAADLTKDDGWDAAVKGCDFVLHVASPLGIGTVKDPNELIIPARDGALRVLRAASKAGVRRVVMTSSVAASGSPIKGPDSENDETRWTNLEAAEFNAYRQSKTIAERAAWDFMAKEKSPTQLVTILPSAVLGPVLSAESLGSVQLVSRLLGGKLPGYPRLGFCVVDVRDVARAHVLAMTSDVAAGERFIAASDFMWMEDISKVLRDRLGERAKKVPKRALPSFVLRLVSLFDKTLQDVTPNLGRKHVHSSAKAQRMLGWKPRPVATTLVECAESLLETNAV